MLLLCCADLLARRRRGIPHVRHIGMTGTVCSVNSWLPCALSSPGLTQQRPPAHPSPSPGALADRYGGKGVLAAGVAAWSLTTCLTPPAAFIGLPALIGMRCAAVRLPAG